MNKKAQTEDVFADLIPSIILIAIGIFILYYFSFSYSGEISDNEFMITTMLDRESFSIEGLMEHQIRIGLEGKKYTTIELLNSYYQENRPAEKAEYEAYLIGSVDDYMSKINPPIKSCFKIILEIQPQELKVIDLCELKYVAVENLKKEYAIIPLKYGDYAKIRIEYDKPFL